MARLVWGAVLLLALAAVGAPAAEVKTINAWAQCGGTSCTGGGCPDGPWMDTQCAEGFGCVRMTSFFWQCKPVATLFGQCGGQGGVCKNGALCSDKAWAACPKGTTCLRQTAFYWQCISDSEVSKVQNDFKVQSFTAADATDLTSQPAQKPATAPTSTAPAKTHAKPVVHPAKPAPAAAKPATAEQKPAVAAPSKPPQVTTFKPPQTTTYKPAAPILPLAPQQQTRAAPRPLWPWSRPAGAAKP